MSQDVFVAAVAKDLPGAPGEDIGLDLDSKRATNTPKRPSLGYASRRHEIVHDLFEGLCWMVKQ